MKKTNSKLVLTIELVLIVVGLVFSTIGLVQSMTSDLPGTQEPTGEMQDIAEMPDVEPAEGEAPDGENPDGEMPPAGENPDGEMAPEQNGAPMAAPTSTLSYIIAYVVPILIYLLLAVYVLVEYRKPHGNLLRVTMLAYALMLAIWSAAQGESAGCVYILPCTSVIIAYLSGRLNKIKKNVWWAAVAALFLIGYGIMQITMAEVEFNVLKCAHALGALLQWVTLMLAYFSRFEEHKQAGAGETPAA